MTTSTDPGTHAAYAVPKPRAAAGRPFIVLLLLAFAVGAWFLWRFWFAAEDPGSHQLIEQARTADIERTVTATGILQPRDYVDVGTQVSGQLRKIHVDIGAQVQAGELLAEIDPTVYRSRVDASRAQLANLKAQLAERHARLTLAEQQYARQRGLMLEDATTAEQLQTAEAELHITRAQIAALEAQVEQTESSLRGDEANLGYTKIHAPMSGTVVSLTARQGQTLNANQQAPIILRIADLAVMTVQAQVSEADVVQLKVGMEAYFSTLGNSSQRWYGKLDKILPTPQVLNNVVLYDALFDVPNPDQALMTNMTAQVFFVVASAEDVVVVPVTALRPASTAAQRGERKAASAADSGTAWIDVVDAGGGIERREVRTGVANRVQVQIVEGLSAGESVVVGQHQSSTGAPGSLRPTRTRPLGL